MYAISKYFLPAACFLLIAVFFMLLPDLRVCTLEGGSRRFRRVDVLLMSAITLIYAVVAFTGLGNTESPQSFVNLEGQTAMIKPDLSDGAVSKLMLFTGVGIGSYSID